MKKILSIAILVLIAGASVYSADNASYWVRKIIVGFDDNAYYCLTYEAVQQGTDNAYTERVFWCKYSNRGAEMERKLVREIEHTFSEESGTWVQRDTHELPLNIFSYLIENNAKLAFPMNASGSSIYLKEDGIYYETAYGRTLIIDSDQIADHIREFESWPDFEKFSTEYFKVAASYASEKTIYIVIQFGGASTDLVLGCYQTGKCQYNLPEKLAYQTVMTMPLKNMPKLRKLTEHKVRTGDNINKIAIKYGVTTKEIIKWNNLKDPNIIRIGQKLKIYKEVK